MEDYLDTLSSLDLTNYVTYNATQEEIQTCGLDDPEATVQVDYTTEDDDGNAGVRQRDAVYQPGP